MALKDLLDVLDGLSHLPDAPTGRYGPARRAVDWLALGLVILTAAATGIALLLGAIATRPWSAYLEFAGSVFMLDAAAAIAIVLVYFVGALIAVLIDRLFARQ